MDDFFSILRSIFPNQVELKLFNLWGQPQLAPLPSWVEASAREMHCTCPHRQHHRIGSEWQVLFHTGNSPPNKKPSPPLIHTASLRCQVIVTFNFWTYHLNPKKCFKNQPCNAETIGQKKGWWTFTKWPNSENFQRSTVTKIQNDCVTNTNQKFLQHLALWSMSSK